MEGNGTFYWTDSSVYRGDFKNGYPCGKGTLTLPDLSCYKGDFNCGFLHGHGSLNVKSTMLLYCGEWLLSNRNGNLTHPLTYKCMLSYLGFPEEPILLKHLLNIL